MAKKDTYYFSHDCNARRDEKIIALRMKYKWEGYGLFWGIIEHLRESENYECVRDYNIIAYDLRVGSDLIKSIVEDFGLFSFTEDGKRFYSERLKKDMAIRADISSKRSAAGKKGGGNPNFKKGQPNIYYQSVDQLDSDLSEEVADEGDINKTLTRDKQDINYKKESKRKEIYKESISKDIPKKVADAHAPAPREKEDVKPKAQRFIPPTVVEVNTYCAERNNGIDAQTFVDFYTAKDWMIGKNKMKDWRAAVRTWERSRGKNGQHGSIQSPRVPDEGTGGGGYTSTI